MTTNTLEELLDAKQRSEHYTGMNYRRLCAILSKYRCTPAVWRLSP